MRIVLNIRNKLLLSFAAVLMLAAIAGAFSISSFINIKRQSEFMAQNFNFSLDVIQKLKVSVLEIQQLMGDATITKTSKPLVEASGWSDTFLTYLDGVSATCVDCHAKVFKEDAGLHTDGKAEINALRADFEAYYKRGLEMANNYLYTGDTEKGKQDMLQFDEASIKLQKNIDSLAEMGFRHLEKSRDTLHKASSNAIRITIGGMMAAFVLGIFIAIISANRTSGAINNIVKSADRIADGILTDPDLEDKSRDEVGNLSKSINRMKGELHGTIAGLTTSASEVASSSDEMNNALGEIKRSITKLSERAETVATSTTEMSQTVLDIAQNAANIAASAENTVKVASNGSTVVLKTVDEVQEISNTVTESANFMTSLGDRSKQIGQIISVINDIADQTNLLALNAAIEAARAGDQGRGFAVVADEVRKLAERTGKATTEISEMIKAIQTETSNAIASMHESKQRVHMGSTHARAAESALRDIVQSVNELMGMVQQIASSTEEMSATSEMISAELESIAVDSHKANSNSDRIAAAAEQLSRLSHGLKNMAGKFKT